MEDGAGIDWDAVAQKAQGIGLPRRGPPDEGRSSLDGFDSREHATELSGRGRSPARHHPSGWATATV